MRCSRAPHLTPARAGRRWRRRRSPCNRSGARCKTPQNCGAVLVGNPGEIAALLVKHNEKADAFTIVPADGQSECGRTAVELVRDGRADFLMKGFVETRDLLRPLVKKENGLNLGRTISHMPFCRFRNRSSSCDHRRRVGNPSVSGGKRDILHNAFELLRRIGYENPAAAAVCAVEHPDPKCPRRWMRPGWPR